MSLSMCILWLPVIWLSRRVFPYVSVFKHGDSHPLWSCCLLGKFPWTKISELPKVTPIQEILVDVGFEYKCKSWILAAKNIIQHFAIDFVHPICIDQGTTQQHGMIPSGIWGFFFQVVTLPRRFRVAEACSGAVDLCRCLLDARPETRAGETIGVFLGGGRGLMRSSTKRQPAPNWQTSGAHGLVKQRSAAVDRSWLELIEEYHMEWTVSLEIFT